MRRLVDVTDLEKFIQENVCAIGDDHLLLVAGDDGRWHEALPLVKTAYDVDEVVQELEEHSFELGTDTLPAHYVRLNEAIEIVKRGGVSDDVCEWTSTQINNEWKPSCEPNSTYNVFGVAWFRKCPYCGKKIKVVE